MVSVSIGSIPRGEYVPTADQRVVMHNLSWTDFEAFLAMRGESLPRVTYLEGTLELMSPSHDHEKINIRLARTVEAYLDQRDIPYEGVGSWLLKSSPEEAGLEPDSCYLIRDLEGDRPHLALEVVWTSGGIQKLEVYRRLGVGEVWFWKNGKLTYFVLVGDAYEERTTSALIPDFDQEVVDQMLELPSLSAVKKALRDRFG